MIVVFIAIFAIAVAEPLNMHAFGAPHVLLTGTLHQPWEEERDGKDERVLECFLEYIEALRGMPTGFLDAPLDLDKYRRVIECASYAPALDMLVTTFDAGDTERADISCAVVNGDDNDDDAAFWEKLSPTYERDVAQRRRFLLLAMSGCQQRRNGMVVAPCTDEQRAAFDAVFPDYAEYSCADAAAAGRVAWEMYSMFSVRLIVRFELHGPIDTTQP
jgi:hypothetical protein